MTRALRALLLSGLCLLAAPSCGPQPVETGSLTSRFVLARQHELALDNVATRLDSSTRTVLSPSRVDWVGRLVRVRRGITVNDPGSIFAVEGSRARHRHSGLDCPSALPLPAADLTAGREILLGLTDAIIFDDQGRDVACHYAGAEVLPVLTLIATFAPALSVEDAVDSTRAAILRRFTRASRRTVIVAADGNRFDTAAAAVDIGTLGGRSVRSSVWISDVRGWKLKLRLTYFTNTTHVAELGAALVLLDKAEDMDASLGGARR
ncbi:MAG: hypothetical protein ACFB6R_11635 [Alphaproteobacteria bacterium]